MQNSDKMFYEKKIVYLDYLEREEKVKNGGYLKWEIRGDVSRVEIHIRGLYPTDTLQGEVCLISFEDVYLADKMALHFGTGEYVAQWKCQNLAETGVSFAECDGIEIRLSEKRVLRGQWRKRRKPEKNETAEAPVIETVTEEGPVIAEENITEEKSVIAEEIMPEKLAATEEIVAVEEVVAAQESSFQMPKKESVLVSDKWEQLNCYYPKIHPFGDNREYLSITPRDFVVLRDKYHNLVHNSFLLHGYYNYGHVVLVKLKEGHEDAYYLGVPGVYFDREKQAALMFGFEGFEADSDKVTDGGFGYYMKKVEL